jgi:hypothetical protein
MYYLEEAESHTCPARHRCGDGEKKTLTLF